MAKSPSPTRPARPTQQSRPGRHRRPHARRVSIVPYAVAGVAVLAAISLAVGVVSRSDDPASSLVQVRAVDVTGRSLPPFGPDAVDPAVGQPAPLVWGETFDGTSLQIAADGTPTIVMFVAHWCPHCQAEVPRVVEWLQSGGPEGVKVLAVSSAADRDRPNYPPSAWLERENWTVPTIADDAAGTAAQAYGVTGYPYFVAVTGSGAVAMRTSGEQSRAGLEALAGAARR